MKTNLTHLLLLMISLSLLSFFNKRTIDCNKIRNGKFHYFTKKTREKINVLRMDSLQLETGTKEGSVPIRCKVIWKSDCEFDLYLNALSKTKLSETDSIIASTPAHVQIIYVGKTFYICTAKLNVFDKELNLQDTVYFGN